MSRPNRRPPHRPLVLVVDDDEILRDAICDVLDFEGYEPLPHRRPEAALACLDGGATPAAIVLDLALPGIGGAGFLNKLRAAPAPLSLFPVLVLSAWENLERHGLSAESVLRKPADPVTLARAIDKLARRPPRPAPRARAGLDVSAGSG
jgi:CheY-like chemotaxis protein